MKATTWIQFRTQLCNAAEERRSKVALFGLEQFYLFISRCSTLFRSPGTKDAQEALNKIQDEGTFLLVADSLRAFREMFSAVQAQGDAQAEPAPAPSARPDPHEAPSNAHGLRGEATTEPQRERSVTPVAASQALYRPRSTSDARDSSGRPFRR